VSRENNTIEILVTTPYVGGRPVLEHFFSLSFLKTIENKVLYQNQVKPKLCLQPTIREQLEINPDIHPCRISVFQNYSPQQIIPTQIPQIAAEDIVNKDKKQI